MLKELTICGIQFSTFNIMVSVGMISALLFLLWECKKQKLSNLYETKVITAYPFCVLFGVICAHMLDVYFHEGFFALFSNSIFRYGITFFGCLIAAIFYLFFHSIIVRLSYLYLLNMYLPLFAIGQAFGRIGCFLGGCCFGRPYEYIGVIYPENSFPYIVYRNVKLFPVQLLESVYLFIVFFIIIRFVKFKFRACVYLILASFGRFIFEFLRGDDRGRVLCDILTPSQLLSLFLFLFGMSIFLYVRDRKIVLCKSSNPANL